MLRCAVYFLTVLCLSRAALLNLKNLEQELKREKKGEESYKPIGPGDIQNGIAEAHHYVGGLKKHMDETVNIVLKVQDNKDKWFEAITNIVQIMHGGAAIFQGAFEKNVGALFAMFMGGHVFKQATRCGSLKQLVYEKKYGTDEDLPNIHLAMAKDVVCFDTLLTEAFNLNSEYDAISCPPTEEEVMRGILDFFRYLFIMRNDGIDFYTAVHNTTAAYEQHQDLGGINTHFHNNFGSQTELVERLLRALESARNRK